MAMGSGIQVVIVNDMAMRLGACMVIVGLLQFIDDGDMAVGE